MKEVIYGIIALITGGSSVCFGLKAFKKSPKILFNKNFWKSTLLNKNTWKLIGKKISIIGKFGEIITKLISK